jgi:hypothetical protein
VFFFSFVYSFLSLLGFHAVKSRNSYRKER